MLFTTANIKPTTWCSWKSEILFYFGTDSYIWNVLNDILYRDSNIFF